MTAVGSAIQFGVEGSSRVSILKWDGRESAHTEDHLAPEEPLEIRVRGRAISVTMRTPGHDEELAAGFLLTEGVVRRAADIELVEACARNEAGNVVNVRLAPLVPVDFDRLTRHVFAGSSCGLCGKATIEAVRGVHAPVESDVRISAAALASLPAKMRAAQGVFERTGGLHAAALFDELGNLLVAREDVGRHNAVDKVIGYALMRGLLPLRRAVLMISGRSSFEIMQKAAAAGVAVVAAVSAPSSLAVQFAREMNQTLIGFLRDARMNIYTHAHRVLLERGDAP
jgi:FdhD protein